MIVVHHLNNSRSQRVLWLLEELGVPYDIRFYERDPKTMLAPPELKKIHPLGKSPVITDGDLVLAETGAILEYLLQKFDAGNLRPKIGTPAATRFTYWMHYAEGSMMPPLLLRLAFSQVEKAPMPFFVKPIAVKIAEGAESAFIAPQIRLHLNYLEGELTKSQWFVGDQFTAADIQMSFPIEAAEARGGLGSERPKLNEYLQRIHSRPAYKRALEKGGPFTLSK